MEKKRSAIWIAIFLVITVSPVFTYFFLGAYVDSKNYENRNMTSKPILTTENYESFPEEYETYYNDNIPFRNQLIRFHNSIDYFLFKQSSSEKVAIGKDGWLFYCSNEDNNPVEQSLGYWNFTNDQLKRIADNLTVTKRVLESQGIEFVLFIAPNKETIYMDKLPDYYEVKSRYTCTDQLIDYLMENTDIQVVYPKQDMLDIKEENPNILLYHKLDTHWNHAGGYIGAKSLASALGIEMPSFSEISLEPIASSSGDLTGMLNITIKNGDTDYKVFDITTLNTVNEKKDFGTEYIYHTAGADPRKLFVKRDSFSTALAPSLATQFEHSIWIHDQIFDQQQIFDYDADIFILETAERYEQSLKNCRVSFFSASIEDSENEIKKISISQTVSTADLLYMSIFKKADKTENTETIQILQPFDETTVLNVPEYENGEIYITIFSDGTGNTILEESTIEY